MKPSTTHIALGLLLASLGQGGYAQGQDARISSWLINSDGSTGSSPDPALNALESAITADIIQVSSNKQMVYVQTSGVPSYPTGPYPDGNPAYAADQHAVYGIPRQPKPAQPGHYAPAGLGAIGVFVNGAALYSYADAKSYKNQGVWHQNANVFERNGFDATPGHPAPQFNAGPVDGQHVPGQYHHHQNPKALRERLGDDGSKHSPILGFAFDGYPVYGPYGYADGKNGSSGIVRMRSSYQLRNIDARTSLPNGKTLAPTAYGPSIAEVALGAYQEDFGYLAGSGDLDEHNGRFSVTPEFPNGTYAYFVTVDESGEGVYPYFIGPTYYGQPIQQSSAGIVPDDAGRAGGS